MVFLGVRIFLKYLQVGSWKRQFLRLSRVFRSLFEVDLIHLVSELYFKIKEAEDESDIQ